MKNKKIADVSLFLLFISFIFISILKFYLPPAFFLDLLRFVIEAALIGGIADWFAITALYKKPLGFPWHTAIIPRNRDKVIQGISVVVEQELLSEETLEKKISMLNITESIISMIDKNGKSNGRFMKIVQEYILHSLETIDVDKIALYLEKLLKDKLKGINLSKHINSILLYSIEKKYYNKPLEQLLEQLIVIVKEEKTKQEIHSMLNKEINKNVNQKTGFKKMLAQLALGVAEQTNSVNLQDAAAAVQKEILVLLLRLKDEEDPLHHDFIEKIKEMGDRLEKDESTISLIEKWKTDTLENLPLHQELLKIIENMLFSLQLLLRKNSFSTEEIAVQNQNAETPVLYTKEIHLLFKWLQQKLSDFWNTFKSNEKAKTIIEKYVKEFIYKTLQSQHDFIGIVITETLGHLSDDALNSFIERKAGNELHWIRINGCLVGGIFGLLLFLFLHGIYIPLMENLFHI